MGPRVSGLGLGLGVYGLGFRVWGSGFFLHLRALLEVVGGSSGDVVLRRRMESQSFAMWGGGGGVKSRVLPGCGGWKCARPQSSYTTLTKALNPKP